MTERDDSDYDELSNGLSYIVLGLLAMAVFVFYGDSLNAVGVIASIVFVGIGIAAVLAPKISPQVTELNRYWTGLFWALCGVGTVAFGLLSSHRRIGGVILGVGIVLCGLFVAFDL